MFVLMGPALPCNVQGTELSEPNKNQHSFINLKNVSRNLLDIRNLVFSKISTSKLKLKKSLAFISPTPFSVYFKYDGK